MTRRNYLALLAASALRARAQGISSRGVKAMPRGKPSGLPFNAHFVDIAEQAGLRQPVIYGGVDRKQYIIETVGCGVAFIDYDNDGWLDIFLLSGTLLQGAPDGCTETRRIGRPAPCCGGRGAGQREPCADQRCKGRVVDQ